jgi:hypothetical protein
MQLLSAFNKFTQAEAELFRKSGSPALLMRLWPLDYAA